MRFRPNDPPRVFEVGFEKKIALRDCGRLELEPDEQVTLTTPAGGEFDVVRKSWGFYATPSLNGRLVQFGLRAALVRSRGPRFYLLLVERARETEFHQYLEAQGMSVVCWLDSERELQTIEQAFSRD